MSSRVHRIAKLHTNGSAERHANLETRSSLVVPEAVEVAGPVRPADKVPLGLVCDLTEDCAAFVTHEIPVTVDGRPGLVYGCLQHALAWAAAEHEED